MVDWQEKVRGRVAPGEYMHSTSWPKGKCSMYVGCLAFPSAKSFLCVIGHCILPHYRCFYAIFAQPAFSSKDSASITFPEMRKTFIVCFNVFVQCEIKWPSSDLLWCDLTKQKPPPGVDSSFQGHLIHFPVFVPFTMSKRAGNKNQLSVLW